ncbi:hypothetical protein [Phenylobacterium sp.]|uniref:hypothetical protein n=1 Tax=Phenylobacterium sp. TaxID=1871053 RepID=UPI002FC63CF7
MSALVDDKPLNPWEPTTDPLDLAILGKLIEEQSELGSAAARCIIQGFEQHEPITGKPNRVWLTEEIADTLANIDKVIEHFGLSEMNIADRRALKLGRLDRWHDMIRKAGRCAPPPENSADDGALAPHALGTGGQKETPTQSTRETLDEG